MQSDTVDFAPGAATWHLDVAYASSLIRPSPSIMWKYDVIHKPEVHNVSHCGQRRTEPRPQVTCTENLVKFGRVDFEICEQTDTNYTLHFYWGRSNEQEDKQG